MNKVLSGLEFSFCYLDDVLIFCKYEKKHLEHLEIIFKHLQECGLNIKPGVNKLSFISHIISPARIQPSEDRVNTVKHFPKSTKL